MPPYAAKHLQRQEMSNMHVANKHANGTDANDGESRRFSAQKLHAVRK